MQKFHGQQVNQYVSNTQYRYRLGTKDNKNKRKYNIIDLLDSHDDMRALAIYVNIKILHVFVMKF